MKVLLIVFLSYYLISYAIVSVLLFKYMKGIYRKEGVKVPWRLHFKLILFPLVGFWLSVLAIFNDYQTFLYNEEVRNYNKTKGK